MYRQKFSTFWEYNITHNIIILYYTNVIIFPQGLMTLTLLQIIASIRRRNGVTFTRIMTMSNFVKISWFSPETGHY
jgi:hypothetical protein